MPQGPICAKFRPLLANNYISLTFQIKLPDSSFVKEGSTFRGLTFNSFILVLFAHLDTNFLRFTIGQEIY